MLFWSRCCTARPGCCPKRPAGRSTRCSSRSDGSFSAPGVWRCSFWQQKKRIRLHLLCAPILGGAACKTLNFLTENYGVSLGYSYGNMVIWPMQTVFTLLFSLFLLREKASARQWLGTGMCILGVAVIAWNGRPVSGMFGEGIGATALFVLSRAFSQQRSRFSRKS